MTELKKCPFCGKEARLIDAECGTTIYAVECVLCQAKIGWFDEKERAIEAWNNRTSPWHTGTPSEGGTFLVCLKDKTYDIYEFGKEYKAWDIGFSDVVKWQKIEEMQDGRTD